MSENAEHQEVPVPGPRSYNRTLGSAKIPSPSGFLNFQHKRGGAGKLQEGHDGTLPTKVCLVKASSHVWIWELGQKNAESRRIDAFELWCWRRFLRVPWTARRSVNPKGNQPWTFIGRTDAETEVPIFQPPDAKSRLLRKDPDAGKDWRQKEKGMTGWDIWMASLTQWTWVSASSRSWWWTGKPGVLQSIGSQRIWHDWATELNGGINVALFIYKG